MPLDSSALTSLLANLGIGSSGVGDLVQYGAAPGMAAAGPIPNADAGMDPMQLMQLLSSSTAASAAPAIGARAPAVQIPAGRQIPPTGAPAPASGQGVDWRALMSLIAPVVGEVASRGSRGSFLEGFMRARERADLTAKQDAEAAQQRKIAGANYLLQIGQHAEGITDPTAFDNFLHQAEHAGTEAGYVQPGELQSAIKFNNQAAREAQLKELTDQLTQLDKNGYNLDDLAASGASLHLKNGQTLPVKTALDLTRERPISASGQPVAKPSKAGGTMDERAALLQTQIRAAKTAGDSTKAATLQAEYDDLVKAAGDMSGAKRAPTDPELADLNKTLKVLAIETAKANLAKQTGTAVDIKPGSKEYRVAQDLAYGKLTMAQFRTLYSYSRDVGAKTSIYDKASELNPNFNPAQFEMGYRLASSPKVQQQLASMDNVVQAVPDLLAASDAAKRSGVTVMNKYTSPIKVSMGSKTFSNLRIARTAFADELSGALGFGSATDMSRAMGFDMTDANLSPENFRSGIQDIVIPFLERKRGTLLKQMGIYGQSGMNPAADATAPPSRIYYDANGTPVKQ